MAPEITKLISAKRELAERLNTETDPLVRTLLEDKILQLSKRITAEKVRQHVMIDNNERARLDAHKARIKCGLRNLGGVAKDKTAHWYWDEAEKQDAVKLERLKNKIQAFLFIVPEKQLVRKFHLLGGLKSTLREIGLSAIIELPEEVRKNKSEPLLKLIEKKLNGEPEKVPFT